MGLALVGGLLVAIDQHDLDAGLRRDIGDAGAHEARAEHADLLQACFGTPWGRRHQLVGVLQAEEQRADHALATGRAAATK